MLKSVLWLFQTLRPERKALITLQARLVADGLMSPPGAVHRLGAGHYYFRAGGDGWIMEFNVHPGHACLLRLTRYAGDKGEALKLFPSIMGREVPLLAAPPPWW